MDGGKSKPQVHIVTPSSSFDHGVSVWSYGSGLAYGVTVWTFGLDFRFRLILREPECATRRNRKSKPELHFIIFYLANTIVWEGRPDFGD
jgi:hypothetical protein